VDTLDNAFHANRNIEWFSISDMICMHLNEIDVIHFDKAFVMYLQEFILYICLHIYE